MPNYNRLAITSQAVCIGRRYKTEGVILKRLNYGEADRILTIYTKHYGKIRAIAKGVRKITSRKGGNVELFNHCVLFLARGRNLDIVTEAQVVNSFSRLSRDLEKTAAAFYVVELVDQLTPDGQVNRQVFDLLVGTLGELSAKRSELGAITQDFEVELLRLLGFWSDKVDIKNVKGYIEEIIERELKSPKFQNKLHTTPDLDINTFGKTQFVCRINPEYFAAMQDLFSNKIVLTGPILRKNRERHNGEGLVDFYPFLSQVCGSPDLVVRNKQDAEAAICYRKCQSRWLRVTVWLKQRNSPAGLENSVLSFRFAHSREVELDKRSNRVVYGRQAVRGGEPPNHTPRDKGVKRDAGCVGARPDA